MKKSYSLIVALLSLAFIGTMISGCGDTSEEYLTPNLPDQITAEQAEFTPPIEKRPHDPSVSIYYGSSSLYVGCQFEATIQNYGWTIENISWSAQGARQVPPVYNNAHKTTWEITSAMSVVVYATITCSFNDIRQTIRVPSSSIANVLPAPRISGFTTAWVNQPTTYTLTSLAQSHTYSWANELYNYKPIVNSANKSITLTFPRIQQYLLSCTIKDENGKEMLTVRQSVDVRQSNSGGGYGPPCIEGEIDPGDIEGPVDRGENPWW